MDQNPDFSDTKTTATMFCMHSPRSIAEWMQQFRATRGLSLHETGNLCQVPHSYIAAIEGGRRREPMKALQRLKKHLTREELEELVLAQSQEFIDRLNEG